MPDLDARATFTGTDADEVGVITVNAAEIGITSYSYGKELGLCWLTPQTARELAAHLIALADQLEGELS